MWCCDNWFPPLPLCFHDTAVFSRMAHLAPGWSNFTILGPIFTILYPFRNTGWIWKQWSPPVRWGLHFLRNKNRKKEKHVSMLQWWALFWIDRFSFLCWICEVTLRNFHWLPWQLHWASSSHSDARWWEVMHMTATENCSLNAKFRWVHWIQRKRNWAQMQAGSNFPPV